MGAREFVLIVMPRQGRYFAAVYNIITWVFKQQFRDSAVTTVEYRPCAFPLKLDLTENYMNLLNICSMFVFKLIMIHATVSSPTLTNLIFFCQ